MHWLVYLCWARQGMLRCQEFTSKMKLERGHLRQRIWGRRNGVSKGLEVRAQVWLRTGHSGMAGAELPESFWTLSEAHDTS